ncbi:winged helix-turn-helix domain-containing protein [Variovorax sp. KK3]|nr:winged helix-turn-helix domain-containing protein [Variovorax sp. KK3]
MPTIRIDDDVLEMLKKLAEPFVDTPNSVIRRLLEGQNASPKKAPPAAVEATPAITVKVKPKSSRGSLTPQPTYEDFLLHTLASQFKGRASKDEVTKAVVDLMESRGILGRPDYEEVTTGETKAVNTIAWARNALKERGLISHLSSRGTWELTPAGMQAAKDIVLPRLKG